MKRARADLKHRARTVARRIGLPSFWQWWAGQLAPLIPYQLRNTVARMRTRPVIAFEPDSAVLFVPRVANNRVKYKEVARIPLSPDAEATAAEGRSVIEALSAGNGARIGPPRVVVAVPPDQVLRKTITLPAAVEENLHQALTYDLDRHTPFKPEEVYFDASVVGRDTVKRELRIDWAAALRTVVGELKRRAESWGASVVAVTPDRPVEGGVPTRMTLNLLPPTERPDAAAGRGWEIWVPLALLAAAALFATALPLWQKRGYAIALQQQAMQARAAADASNALREQLERLTGDYNFALSRKYAFPSALQSVEDLSKLLPDDTWLTQLEVKNTAKGKDARREIVVRGESANAGRLISLFEESKLFSDAAPRSPTTKIQPGPGEIFDLGAQLKPLAPPSPVQLASAGETGSPAPAAPAPAVTPAAAAKSAEPSKAEPTESVGVNEPTKSAAKPDPAPQATTNAPSGSSLTPAAPPATAATPAAPAAAAGPAPPAAPRASLPPGATAPEPSAGTFAESQPGGGRPLGSARPQRPPRKATP
jgi:general secretion pathway protein L